MEAIRHSTPPLYLIAFAATTITAVTVTLLWQFSFGFQVYYVALFASAFFLAISTRQNEQLLGIVLGLFITLMFHWQLRDFLSAALPSQAIKSEGSIKIEQYIIPVSLVAMGLGWMLGLRRQKKFNDFHSDFEFIEKDCFVPKHPSYCIQFARRQFDSKMKIDNQKLHWQAIDLSPVKMDSCIKRELIHFENGERVGQISVGVTDFNFLGISKFAKDPLLSYVAVRLTSGDFYELVEYRGQRFNIEVYFKGKLIGQYVDENPPKEGATWWQRTFRLNRSWKIVADDKTVGRFQFKSPVDNKTKFHASYGGEIEIPISNPMVGFSKLNSRVVPPLEHEQKIPNRIKQLHFLLVIYFRTMIFRPSTGSGGDSGG